MKKIIIFIFVFFHSVSVFALISPDSTDFSNYDYSEAHFDSLINKTLPCTDFGDLDFFGGSKSSSHCVGHGWFEQTISHNETNEWGYVWTTIRSPDISTLYNSCPNGAETFASSYFFYYGYYSYTHSLCHSDCSAAGISDSECFCPDGEIASSTKRFVVCASIPVSDSEGRKSEQTAKKQNDLITESNSKYGSIAATNSTSTNLLQKIKDSLSGLLSRNYGVLGSPTDSNNSNSDIKENTDSADSDTKFSESVTDFSTLKPTFTKAGSCPRASSFTVGFSSLSFSYQPLCDFSQKIRSYVIAIARVSAAFIILGAL